MRPRSSLAAIVLTVAVAMPAHAQLLGKPGAASLFGPEGSQVLALPTDAELAAAVPPGRKAEGSAVIHCNITADGHLTACAKTLERGSGLADALISLAPRFRIKVLEDAPAEERVAVATATWPAPDAPADWQVQPKPGDFAITYGGLAGNSKRPGFTVMNCLEGKTGALHQCAVVFQTPPGMGFGALMLQFSAYLKLKPALLAGKPVNSAVNVVFHFNTYTPGQKDPFFP